MQQNRHYTLRCSGRVAANSGESWRMVFASAAILTESLTVAVHALEKPCIYAGFISLNTDGHGCTRIFSNVRNAWKIHFLCCWQNPTVTARRRQKIVATRFRKGGRLVLTSKAMTTNHTEYLKYYHLEKYLFGEVSNRFRTEGFLTAFDFFCIVIWKANRAKSKVAQRLLKQGYNDLDTAVRTLTSEIYRENEPRRQLEIIMDKDKWKFRLPMATAVLTVLYPEEFTIYDVRVCKILNAFKDLQHKTRFEDIWSGYEEFIRRVKSAASEQSTLRDKDRELWGKSFAVQLMKEIENKFPREADKSKSEE